MLKDKLDIIDEELRSYRKKGKKIGFFIVYPITLSDIQEWGFAKYVEVVSILSIEPLKQIPAKFKTDELDEFDLFKLLIQNNEEFADKYLEALNLISNVDFVIVGGFIGSQDYLLSKEHFVQIREFIMHEHSLEPVEEFIPANDKAEEIKRKIEENKKIVEKAKSKKTHNSPTLSDLILALIAVDSSYNFDNVWNLSYFQFNQLLNKHQVIDNYDVGIKQLLAGADAKKVEVKHWLLK